MFNFFKKKPFQLYTPGNGEIIPISQIPDPAFAEKMVGDGVGFVPTKGEILSPCQGTVSHIFPTSHAIMIESKEGLDILLHLGIDTVELKGEGFTPLVKTGATVEPGTPLVQMDLSFIKSKGKSIVCPLIITNTDDIKEINYNSHKHASPEDIALEVSMK